MTPEWLRLRFPPPLASAIGMVEAPTAILATAKVRYEDWMRWVLPYHGALLLLGILPIGTAIAVGLQGVSASP